MGNAMSVINYCDHCGSLVFKRSSGFWKASFGPNWGVGCFRNPVMYRLSDGRRVPVYGQHKVGVS